MQRMGESDRTWTEHNDDDDRDDDRCGKSTQKQDMIQLEPTNEVNESIINGIDQILMGGLTIPRSRQYSQSQK